MRNKVSRGLLKTLLLLVITNMAMANERAQVAIGERLFLETRFAQAFYAHPGSTDKSLQDTLTLSAQLPGPFAGQTMSCRACHMLDEQRDSPDAGLRNYADFARTSPIPDRQDNHFHTPRNTMALVNVTVPGDMALFHYDGMFNSMVDLVKGTLTGRNFGWLATEKQVAIKHIADVIRNDDGFGGLARKFGGSYAKVFDGKARSIPKAFSLPEQFRLNVYKASDTQIFDLVARLISEYVQDKNYRRDQQGRYIGSPYDQFLILNDLPRQPLANESDLEYSQRLVKALNQLSKPKFVTEQQGHFKTHKQSFVFGQKELDGMKLFFTRSDREFTGGNCIACHPAPHFSDYKFHNIGVTQFDYDKKHEFGAFKKLYIPDLKERNENYDKYLPATQRHPAASGSFKQLAYTNKPGITDLGMWNVFANPDIPAPQKKLQTILCEQAKQRGIKECLNADLLPLSIGSFKTPVLRDLGHSAPYMHNGEFDTLSEVVKLYMSIPILAQQGLIRNADPALQHVKISFVDFAQLVAFLQSLNEDYQ